MASLNRAHSPAKIVDDMAELNAHIAQLKLRSVDDYRDWCQRRGFSSRTRKTRRERAKEREFAGREAAAARLRQKKQEVRNPDQILQAIFSGRLVEAQITQPHLQEVCRKLKSADDCRGTRRAFCDLVRHVSRCAELCDSRPVIASFGSTAGNTYVGGLLALARRHVSWRRPLTEWNPRTHNSRRQFASLARHLLAEYSIPTFMDAVWFLDPGPAATRQQKWFVHLGRGENIRTADLPVSYTKRMAHHFMQAPADLSVEAALRWGQIHGLGGEERLVRTIAGTKLGRSFGQDEFWVTVLRWLIAQPMLDMAQVGPIVDYIEHQKFEHRDVFIAPGRVERQPPAQPNLSMKGRTAAALLRQVEAWHRGLARTQQAPAEWSRSGIAGFEFIEGSAEGGNLKIWTLTELLSSRALTTEGRVMKHCVATYARSCARGACSIWTLEVESFEGRRKVLTVEVDLQGKRICQARGKCNAAASDKHRLLLRRWADQSGLHLMDWV